MYTCVYKYMCIYTHPYIYRERVNGKSLVNQEETLPYYSITMTKHQTESV